MGAAPAKNGARHRREGDEVAAKFGSSLGITWWKLEVLASSVMPVATFAHIASVRASSTTRWVKGALATQHLTLTRSDLRSSRQTGMVLLTLRCHAGDLATLNTAFLTDNNKDHFLSSAIFPHGTLLYLLSLVFD